MKQLMMGFTLMELLVVIVIVGILAGFAIPTYNDQIRKSRRFDAKSTLLLISAAQEQYRTNNINYGSLTDVWGGVSVTPEGHYNITITDNTNTGFTVTTTPVSGDDQINDDEPGVNCGTMKITVQGLTTFREPVECW